MKRQPTLADRFLVAADTGVATKSFYASTRGNLLEAKRFVLDESAARYVAEMIRDLPRAIADGQEFAIPPFKKTWIEFPIHEFYEIINGMPPDETSDTHIGFLIVGNVVRVVAGGCPTGFDATVMPVEYHLWQPLTLEQELKLCEQVRLSRMGLDLLYWGKSVSQLEEDKDQAGVRALRANHSFRLMLRPEITETKWFNPVEQFGDLRNIIALLLFLNRTQDMIKSVQVPHARGMIGHKAGTFLSHNVITVHVSPKTRLQKMVAGEGVWRRLHDVRGHFCHNERARQAGMAWCGHEWEEYEPLRWHCTLCEGKRWWRHEHQRGHEEKGLVTSEYRVTE